ncbi:hypothetical protein KO498_01150 [Lentibacter algarum]|uniref:hypothetical protein n=1 Tax=Lentibacter algarum TaxID=576131 RepID=UPI001C0746E3|nr:hypothetical protein [Lentibacter algarum]MBU2980406.1 hypothetical protein [Lentibacter algarum]
MKQIILSCAVLALMTAPLHAGCYADYKAKQDNPLKLHYGVASVSGACNKKSARASLAPRLASKGWTLLNVLNVFDDSGLNQRKASAGQYFLRY